MGTKKSTTLGKDKQSNFTEDEIKELKSQDEFTDDEEVLDRTAVPGQSLSDLNKQIRERLKAEGKSTRVMDSDSQRKNAISRLVTALNKRGWVSKGVGIYELNDRHKLSIDGALFEADVDGHILPLGKGALKTLDQYISLSRVSATTDTSSL